MKARVEVRPRAGVLDPQGKAIEGALGGLGFHGVGAVRAGKLIELDLPGIHDAEQARAEVSRMCEMLLANPVIEDWRVEIVD